VGRVWKRSISSIDTYLIHMTRYKRKPHKVICQCTPCKTKRHEIDQRGVNNPNYGKHYRHTLEMRKFIGDLHRGKKASNWKGGVTPIQRQIRSNFLYRLWRSDVFIRENYTCQDCYVHGGYLEAHHIKPVSSIIAENCIRTLIELIECSEMWNINNGITLCLRCHKKRHYE
jgi:5-methylcytosine-specific restriction endonuclease McrA